MARRDQPKAVDQPGRAQGGHRPWPGEVRPRRTSRAPALDEGKRCWTLHYSGFHLDVLPALPNPDAALGSAIIITDTEVVRWQFSNPIAYADWFHKVMAKEIEDKLKVVAKRMDIAQVPDWQVKTTLQQTVQALKRHRDIYFTDALDLRPASIIITTLAAHAYRGSGGDLYEVLDDITDRMPGFVQHDGQRYVVANPVEPGENFADRWHGKPERRRGVLPVDRAGQGRLRRPGPRWRRTSTRSSRRWPPCSGTVPPGKPAEAFPAASWKAAARASSATAREREPWPPPRPPGHGASRGTTTSMATTARARSLSMAQQAFGLRSVFPDAEPDPEARTDCPGQDDCSPATCPASTPSRSSTREDATRPSGSSPPAQGDRERIPAPHLRRRNPLPARRRAVGRNHADRRHHRPVDRRMAAALRDMAGHRRMVRRPRLQHPSPGPLRRPASTVTHRTSYPAGAWYPRPHDAGPQTTRPARLDTMTRTSQGFGMSDPHAPQLGDTLKAERRRRRLSLREVSYETGISVNTLSRVERGYLPDLKNYQRLVDWLGVPADTFLETSSPESPAGTLDLVARHFRSDPA